MKHANWNKHKTSAMAKARWSRLIPALLVCTALLAGNGVQAEERELNAMNGKQKLVGTLEMATTSAQPDLVALIIAGSGPTDRDGNSKAVAGKNDSLKKLAADLAQFGLSSLRFDKRVAGASLSGPVDETALRIETFAEDAAAWLPVLQQQGFKRVLVIGHSEGALLGTLIAHRRPVSGLVLIAGAGRPIDVILKEQLARNAPQLSAEVSRILDELKAGKDASNVPPPLQALFRPSVQPYLRGWMQLDPAKLLAAVKVPVLNLSGSHDMQVQQADADALAAVTGVKSQRIRGMNHVLKRVSGMDLAAQQDAYTDPDLPLVPELVPAILAFARELPKSGAGK